MKHKPRLIVLTLLLLASCNLLRPTPPNDKGGKIDRDSLPPLPAKHTQRISQYVFFSDTEIKRDLPLFQELSDLRDQVYKELQLPTANTVVLVYLFEDETRYERYMKARYPDLPVRRAFFVAQEKYAGGPEDLIVFTFWGDNIRKDLRHELTHGLLHSVLKDVPLWLDEGLAEYYEVPPERWGVNLTHLEQLRREEFRPNLTRLEQLGQVRQMTPAEYREAWAWVHFLLRDKPETRTVLLKYLQQLRTNPKPGPLQPRLTEVVLSPEVALEKHLAQLAVSPRPSPAAQK